MLPRELLPCWMARIFQVVAGKAQAEKQGMLDALGGPYQRDASPCDGSAAIEPHRHVWEVAAR